MNRSEYFKDGPGKTPVLVDDGKTNVRPLQLLIAPFAENRIVRFETEQRQKRVKNCDNKYLI